MPLAGGLGASVGPPYQGVPKLIASGLIGHAANGTQSRQTVLSKGATQNSSDEQSSVRRALLASPDICRAGRSVQRVGQSAAARDGRGR